VKKVELNNPACLFTHNRSFRTLPRLPDSRLHLN